MPESDTFVADGGFAVGDFEPDPYYTAERHNNNEVVIPKEFIGGGYSCYLIREMIKAGRDVPKELKAAARKEKENLDRIDRDWKEKVWATRKDRGFDQEHIGEKYKFEYLEVDKRLGSKVEQILADAEKLIERGSVKPGELGHLVRRTIGVHVYPDNFYIDEWVDIQEIYLVNELLIPVLEKVESASEQMSTEEKRILLNRLQNHAMEAWRLGFEYNNFSQEIVRTMVQVGGVENTDIVLETVKIVDINVTRYIDEMNDIYRESESLEISTNMSGKSDVLYFDREALEHSHPNYRDTWAKIIDVGFDDHNGVEKATLLIRVKKGQELTEDQLTEVMRDLSIKLEVPFNISIQGLRPEIVEDIQHLDTSRSNMEYGESEIQSLHFAVCDGVDTLIRNGEDKTKLAQFLCEVIRYDPSGCLRRYRDTFDRLGFASTRSVLLENLKNEDITTRRFCAELLYSIETGQIPVDNEEGVDCYGKLYKLAKKGDPDFFVKLYSNPGAFVQRVDNAGKIGVFGADKKLLGFFVLDLETEGGVINALVRDINKEDIFLPKADETPDERKTRELLTQIFLVNYEETRRNVKKQTGVDLTSLRLHEQGVFMSFYAGEQFSGELKARVTDMVRKYGKLGVVLFVALNYSGVPERLLDFVEDKNTHKEEKIKIMSRYADVLKRAEEWRVLFTGLEENSGLNFANEIYEAMVRKSAEYLQAAMLIDSGENTEITMEELLDSLENVSFALEKLKGLYEENTSLKLVRHQFHGGYERQNELDSFNPQAGETWNFEDSDGSTVSVTIRLKQVYDKNGEKSEGRVNFKVNNKKAKKSCRFGIDMDTYHMRKGEAEKERLCFDVATGQTIFKEGVYGTKEIDRVLGAVDVSEGGHTYLPFSKESANRYGEIATNFRRYMVERFGLNERKRKHERI